MPTSTPKRNGEGQQFRNGPGERRKPTTMGLAFAAYQHLEQLVGLLQEVARKSRGMVPSSALGRISRKTYRLRMRTPEPLVLNQFGRGHQRQLRQSLPRPGATPGRRRAPKANDETSAVNPPPPKNGEGRPFSIYSRVTLSSPTARCPSGFAGEAAETEAADQLFLAVGDNFVEPVRAGSPAAPTLRAAIKRRASSAEPEVREIHFARP